MKQLAQAIIKVMQEVKGMEQNSKVGTGSYGYSGTKDMDVKEVFNKAFANNDLCILPIEVTPTIKIDRWMEGTKSKQSVFTEVQTKYMLIHSSGEQIELAGYGHGIDPQDKGAGKATTYALKNCLLYAFLTPVGKIDDTDTIHSNDIQTPAKKETTDDKKKALDLEIAVAAINGSKTLEDLKANYQAYIKFSKVYSFIQAKEAKKKELTPK